jgi:hypothetical protein
MLFFIVFLIFSISFGSLHASGRSLKDAFELNIKSDLVKSVAVF